MADHSVKRKLAELLWLVLNALHALAVQQIPLMQVVAGLLEQLQNTTDRDRKEWEAFAQTMYDEVGKARAARNVLQRYSLLVLPVLLHAACTVQQRRMHFQPYTAHLQHTSHLLAILATCMQQTSRCLQEMQDKLHAVLKALGCMCF